MVDQENITSIIRTTIYSKTFVGPTPSIDDVANAIFKELNRCFIIIDKPKTTIKLNKELK
jgi:hypothetical protein